MIEINRNSEYTYRQNPYQPRLLDKRENKHGARWQPYDIYPTVEEAIEALIAIERDAKPVSK